MVYSTVILIDNDGNEKDSNSIWCIACLANNFNQYTKATIEILKTEVNDPSMFKTWVDFLYEVSFKFEVREDKLYYYFDLDLTFYNRYCKLVTFLTLCRALSSQYSAKSIISKFKRNKEIFTELDNIQLYQLSHYNTNYSYGFDYLHQPFSIATKFITLEQFKERFPNCQSLNSIFQGYDIITDQRKLISLLNTPEENKEEILKIIL